MTALLTQAEVDALPDGTRILVTWSGGNGPHVLATRRDEWGTVCAHTIGVLNLFINTLDHVGPHPLTQVSLAPIGNTASTD